MKSALRHARVVLVCGKGGVGKTTVSAALAVQAAREGRKTLVCTIDPARRLANALGVSRLSDRPRRLPAAWLSRAGLPANLDLSAAMLDTKRVFDEVVLRHAPSPAAARRILDNPFYQAVSNYLAGSQEYMAVERLHELAQAGGYDRIVLDTPPSRHALDFLDAPRRLTDFLETGFLGWILKPTVNAGVEFLAGTGAKALDVVVDLLGSELLRSVSDFFRAFQGMYPGFQERARAVRRLLRSSETAFVLVTTPAPRALAETRLFVTRLREFGFPVRGVIVNRVAPDLRAGEGKGPAGRPSAGGGARGAVPAGLAGALERNLRELRALARRDRARVDAALAELPRDLATAEVPDHAVEVKDLAGLAGMADRIFGGGGEREGGVGLTRPVAATKAR
ncbi:MAG: ArsA family ATPase [Planctomycetes bacterium]|nr:ArsA family ATPase [Planctomycetota bacterium]